MRHKQHIIGIDARMYGASQTGIGKYIARLLEFTPPRMPETRFIAFLRDPEYAEFSSSHPNVEKRRVTAKWYDYREQLVLPFELMRTRIDLMHFPHFNAPILYPGRLMVTIHDLTPHAFPGPNMRSFWRRTMYHAVFSSAVRRARRIIAVSDYTKSDIIKTFGTDEERIAVIREGIDSAFFAPHHKETSKALLWQRYGIARPFILYVGVWREHKNLVGLIEAFSKLNKKYHCDDVDLVLCGKEQRSYPQARHAWRRLGLDRRVKLPGFIPEDELPYFYRAAELTVIPSFAEGFGFTGLESLACGTPVAASDATALPETLDDAAAYFDPRDTDEMAECLFKVLKNNALRTKLIANAPEVLAQYRWETMADETAKLYHEILNP
ncbi:MAG: glycosyltransferase family 1 protein [bacterium]|nr:glycosyltransferase family 1 protein [bacterium]